MTTFVIDRLEAVDFFETSDFLAVKLIAADGEVVGIVFYAELARDLALAITAKLDDPSTPESQPSQPEIGLRSDWVVETTPLGPYLALPLTDGRLLEMSLSPDQARGLGQALLDSASKARGGLN